jgi:hypothetical protein
MRSDSGDIAGDVAALDGKRSAVARDDTDRVFGNLSSIPSVAI